VKQLPPLHGVQTWQEIVKHLDFLGPKATTQVLMMEDKNCAIGKIM